MSGHTHCWHPAENFGGIKHTHVCCGAAPGENKLFKICGSVMYCPNWQMEEKTHGIGFVESDMIRAVKRSNWAVAQAIMASVVAAGLSGIHEDPFSHP